MTATESTVEGPFHMVDSPPRDVGANIALDGKGEPCLVTGTDGTPLACATFDVWQANDDGFYDVQQPECSLRGLPNPFRAIHLDLVLRPVRS